MKIEIKELEKIRLEPGDVLVIKMSSHDYGVMTKIGADEEVLKLFPNNKVVCCTQKTEFEVIKQKVLNEN